MRIRPASTDDAPTLAEIHAQAFASPWSAAAIADVLAQGFGHLIERHVRPGEGRPSGFVLCRAAGQEAEILTLAVAPAARRRGFARALLEAALHEARSRRARSLFLEVAEDNEAALVLYRSAGFSSVGRRSGYYVDRYGRADALILRRDL
ncbi:MAG: ribosomal protein S18-alanine N-acetyltransferase [Caulobacteraceae bacterium]